MIKSALLALFGACCIAASHAGEIDFSKTDYSQYARPERMRLARCFSDILAVVERHGLRNELWDFLAAGCVAEQRSVEAALASRRPPGFDELPSDTAGQILGSPYISSMMRAAEEQYTSKSVAFCKGDSCVLEDYRKCLAVKSAAEISRQSSPLTFEKSAKSDCGRSEALARAVLTNEFLAAQRLQESPRLSSKTRELIDQVILAIGRDAVVAYAEDLVKAVPGRKSCKIPVQMCGASECISLDETTPEQREYECAIASPPGPTDRR